MLVGTLVTVMVLTLLYWGHYAGNAEMAPLLDQSLERGGDRQNQPGAGFQGRASTPSWAMTR